MNLASSVSSVPSLQSQISPSPSQSPNKPIRVTSNGSGHDATKGQEKEKEREKEQGPEIPENGLLIPTDRYREEMEGKWIHHLGRFRVHSELTLHGYSLYSLRTWYLSRTHWAQTIATPTGPRDQITVYLLVPDPELSDRQAKEELERAIRYLITESGDHPCQRRKTEYGTLLINKAQNFGQDVSPIPGGDLREAKPYMIVNTGLRRLGCGARAALGIEPPAPALRRKFHELYRLPQPPHSSISPPTSPKHTRDRHQSPHTQPQSQPSSQEFRHDPFAMMVVEIVRLVQAALAIWGLFGIGRDELDVNGLFCDETKAGIFKWRHIMGMEKETLKLEKETSGGCIDPKTLAALLSSITSVTYELRVLGVDGLPKDPFRNPKRFLYAWRAARDDELLLSDYIDIGSIRNLNKSYIARRSKSPFSVHHSVLSGVAHATSSISANLKGTSTEDGPLRRREVRPDFSNHSGESGLKLITPDHEVGSTAPPDVITTNLEAYTNGIKKCREKDWIDMGAKKIGDLWKGNLGVGSEEKRTFGVFRKGTIREEGTEEDSEDGGARGVLGKTGKAFKGLVARKGSVVETSDSEGGGKYNFSRRKQSIVPTVLEPDLEEVDEQVYDRFSASPSPSGPQRLDVPLNPSSQSFRSHRSNGSRAFRPSIITDLSNGSYELRPSSPSHHHPSNSTTTAPSTSTAQPHSNVNGNGNGRLIRSVSERAEMWRSRGTAVAMLRTSSTGADVRPDETGNEWEVVEPHGTGKGQGRQPDLSLGLGQDVDMGKIKRRHSQQDIKAYQFTRVEKHQHLAVDVEMCSLVLELRHKKKELARMNAEMKILAESIIYASREMAQITQQRQSNLDNHLQPQIEDLEARLAGSIEDIIEGNNDESIRRSAQTVRYYASEEPQFEALIDRMEMLGRQYKLVRAKAATVGVGAGVGQVR